MTITLAFDRKRSGTPPVGYLGSTARRSDHDCLNRSHLDAVLQARRDRENFAHQSGGATPGPFHTRAGDAAPGLPAVSIIERESVHPWRWVAAFWLCFGIACGALFAPLPVQIAVGVGIVFATGLVIRAAVRW